MIKNTITAGFFAGEFGWQLMRWQGHLRYLSKDNNIIVGCEPAYRYLYSDFAKSFVDFEEPIQTRNMWLCNGSVYPIDSDSIVPHRKICLNPKLKQEFIQFGAPKKSSFSIIIHARNTTNLGTAYRNWPLSNWVELVKKCHELPGKILSIGTKLGAHHIPGTIDGRGIDLKRLCDIIRSSKVFVSPSSGPAHLASLCGIPHIVWGNCRDTGVTDNKLRYEKTWNPLNTKVIFIPTWQPIVDVVYKEVIKCIQF